MSLTRLAKTIRVALTTNRDYQNDEKHQRSIVWRRTLLQGWIWMTLACFCAVIVTPNWYTIGPRSYMYPPEYKMLSLSDITTFRAGNSYFKTGSTVTSPLAAYVDAICRMTVATDCDALADNAIAAVLECRQLQMVQKYNALMPCLYKGSVRYHALPYAAPVPSNITVNFTYWEQDAKILMPREVPMGGEMWRQALKDGHFLEFWTPCKFTKTQCQAQRHLQNECPPGYDFLAYEDDICRVNMCRIKCGAVPVAGTPLCAPPSCKPTKVNYIHAFTKVLNDQDSPHNKWCPAAENQCVVFREFMSHGQTARAGFITVVATLTGAGYFVTFSRRRKHYVMCCLVLSLIASCIAAVVLYTYTSSVEDLLSRISVPQDDVNRFYFHPILNVDIRNVTEWNWRRLTAQMQLAHQSSQFPQGFQRLFGYYFAVIFVVISFLSTLFSMDFCIFLYCGISPTITILNRMWRNVFCILLVVKRILDSGLRSFDVMAKDPLGKIYSTISSGQRYKGRLLDIFWDYVILFPVHFIRSFFSTPTASDISSDTEKDALRRVGVHFDRCHSYLTARRSYLVMLCFLGFICMPFRIVTMLSSVRSLYSAEYGAYYPGDFDAFSCDIKGGRCLSDRTPVKSDDLHVDLLRTRVQRSFVYNTYEAFAKDKRSVYKVHVRPDWLDSCGDSGGYISVKKAVKESTWDSLQQGYLKVQVKWDRLSINTIAKTKQMINTYRYQDDYLVDNNGSLVRFDTAQVGKIVRRGPKWIFSEISDWCGSTGVITKIGWTTMTVHWPLPYDENHPHETDWDAIQAWYATNSWYIIDMDSEMNKSELLLEQATRFFDFLHYLQVIASTVYSELRRQAISVDSLKMGILSAIQMIGLLLVAHSLRQWTHFGRATQFLLVGWAFWSFAPVVISLIPVRSFVDLTETSAMLNTFLSESRDELSTDRWLALCDRMDANFLSTSVKRAMSVCAEIEDWALRTKQPSWKQPSTWIPFTLTKWSHMTYLVEQAAAVCHNMTDSNQLGDAIPIPNINETAAALMNVCTDLGNSFGGRSIDAVIGNIYVGRNVIPGQHWDEATDGSRLEYWRGTITAINNSTSSCTVCWDADASHACKAGKNVTYTCAPDVTPLGIADAKSTIGRSAFMYIEWAKAELHAWQSDFPEMIRILIGMRGSMYNFFTLCMTAAFFTTPLMKAALRMKTIFPYTTVLAIFLTLSFVGCPLVWAATQFIPQIVGSNYLTFVFLIYSFSPLLYFVFGKYYNISQPMDDQQSVNVIFTVRYYLSFTNSLIPFLLLLLWLCFGSYVYLPTIRTMVTTLPSLELVVFLTSYLLISYLLSMQAGFDWYAGEFTTQHKYKHAPMVVANTDNIQEAAHAQKLCGADIDLASIDDATYVCGGVADRSRLRRENLLGIRTWAEKARTYQVSLNNKYNDSMDALTAALEDHGEYPRAKMEERRRTLIEVLRASRAQRNHDLLHKETAAPHAFMGNSTAVSTQRTESSASSRSSFFDVAHTPFDPFGSSWNEGRDRHRGPSEHYGPFPHAGQYSPGELGYIGFAQADLRHSQEYSRRADPRVSQHPDFNRRSDAWMRQDRHPNFNRRDADPRFDLHPNFNRRDEDPRFDGM